MGDHCRYPIIQQGIHPRNSKVTLTSRDDGPVVNLLRILDQFDGVFETLQSLVLSTLDEGDLLLLLLALTFGRIPQESVGTLLASLLAGVIGIAAGVIFIFAGLLLAALLLRALVDILFLIGGAGLAVATTTVEESRRHRVFD